jgi:hypothetical protein
VNARSNKSKPHKSRGDAQRPQSAPRANRPNPDVPAEAAPPQNHSDATPMEENSEIIRRDARTTRPGTGDPRATAPGVGPGATVTDKSLRPSVLRWKSWQVSDSFREYAERAARGEKLPRFEGSILADPSRMLPAPADASGQRRAARLKAPRSTWMNPNSWVWNPWLWAASAAVFAVGLFSATLWYTTPREEVSWDTNALTPAPQLPSAPTAPAERTWETTPAAPVSDAPAVEIPAASTARAPSTPPAPVVTARPPSTAEKLAAARPVAPAPPIAAAPDSPSVATVEPTPTATATMAKSAPVDRTAAELDSFLKGLELQPGARRATGAPAATYPTPPPAAAGAGAPPAAVATPAPPPSDGSDPLLVEAPSF